MRSITPGGLVNRVVSSAESFVDKNHKKQLVYNSSHGQKQLHAAALGQKLLSGGGGGNGGGNGGGPRTIGPGPRKTFLLELSVLNFGGANVANGVGGAGGGDPYIFGSQKHWHMHGLGSGHAKRCVRTSC